MFYKVFLSFTSNITILISQDHQCLYILLLLYTLVLWRKATEDMAFNKNLSKCSLYESEATIGHGIMMEEDDTESCYFEAFHLFTTQKPTISVNDLLYAMRTAGANPTESELQVDSRE